MITVEKLREYGADVEDGLARCMNNEEFYLMLVGMAVQDPGCEKLESAIEKGDLGEAFEAAHALKGILANLSLTPLLKPVEEITELLRAGTQMDYTAMVKEICEKKAALDALAAD